MRHSQFVPVVYSEKVRLRHSAKLPQIVKGSDRPWQVAKFFSKLVDDSKCLMSWNDVKISISHHTVRSDYQRCLNSLRFPFSHRSRLYWYTHTGMKYRKTRITTYPDREVCILRTLTLRKGLWSNWTTPATKSVCELDRKVTELRARLATPTTVWKTTSFVTSADGWKPSSTIIGRLRCL